ncbi:uncharacterized protein J4E88_004949 [Alternaria novae-zelandiae]|uniref:uncharacterized protein n=1 Tax=Alternaria novae-zelandiae TaxID=430562 RepID=UPI0020C24F9B|nr:uncharacterized protein J4E88_004949 [Alternaria novae-zelandiae]KAI4682061.1 hypothetical protein J4E88_004949 [Alternaria novae-zelandiae]
MNGDSGPKRTIHIEEGQHYLLEPDDELPLKLLRNLGQGGCANVEEVVDRHTGRVFARKVFGIRGSATERRRIFDNEIKVIRRLAPHRHITRIFATYVEKREVGILLTPVADGGSLDKFLEDAHEGLLTQSEVDTLDYSFGCLASGLHFMHAQKVRHKDIKPHNILVHKGSFIYTDFGSSLDYSTGTRSDTTGHPESITRKYAAPEVPQDGEAASALARAAATHDDMMRFLISPETSDETTLSALAPYVIRNPRPSVHGEPAADLALPDGESEHRKTPKPLPNHDRRNRKKESYHFGELFGEKRPKDGG